MTQMTPYPLSVPEMTPETAGVIVGLLQQRAGITIPAQKTDLLRNRLGRRLRALAIDDFERYIEHLRGPGGGEEATALVEALTTHTTAFFREGRQYDWLASHALAELAAQGRGETHELMIWSAACSTGAEIWSAAMVIEAFGRRNNRPLNYRGFGTDISRPILTKASRAVYSEGEIAGVPEDLRRAYLLKSRPGRVGSDGRPVYRIAPELRGRITFMQANLMALDKAPRIVADIAFLRNVLIYFQRDDQDRIVRSVASRLRPGGYLLTGHAEALPTTPPGLTTIASSIYRKEY